MANCIVENIIYTGSVSHTGGTSNQFFKANGTLDSTKYVGGSGISYVVVNATGTTAENLAIFNEAYSAAKSMTPFGSALSATNRVRLILAPTIYGNSTSTYTFDGSYVDIVAMSSKCVVKFPGTITISAHDTYYCGIDSLYHQSFIFTSTGLNNTIENCKAGASSFRNSSVSLLGNFINCSGGTSCFGINSHSGSTFINCIGGEQSFSGPTATSNGTYINCTASHYSFGAIGGALGKYYGCKSGEASFGGYGTASGSFYDCTAGSYSFGGGDSDIDGAGTASGSFYRCSGYTNCFGGGLDGVSSGVFDSCIAGEASYGYTSSGTYNKCISGAYSFGWANSYSGHIYYCKTYRTFPTTGGKIVLSVQGADGANTVVNR